MLKHFIYLVLALMGMALCLPSCMTKKKLAKLKNEYQILYKGLDSLGEVKKWSPRRIKTGDRITIQIKTESLNSEQIAIFENGKEVDYIVGLDSTVVLPILGSLKVAGLTRSEAVDIVKKSAAKFIKDPYVSIRPLDIQVKVIGEFEKQGIISLPENDATLINAISQVGGFKQFSKRDSIYVIRETDSLRSLYVVDFRSASAVYNSNVFQLQQNDVIYVQPNTVFFKSLRNSENNIAIAALNPITAILGILFFSIPIITFLR
jgi:polysaccharide export outer membrane protein